MTITGIPSIIRTTADLEQLWRTAMEPLGFARRTLWLTFLDDDVPTGVMVEITDLPPAPRNEDVAAYASLLGHLPNLEDGMRIALLVSRPGDGGPTAQDEAWGRALRTAARRARIGAETVFLATDTDVVALRP